MPTIQNGNATLYYEEHGKGFPIFTFAPAGLKSTIGVWSEASAPINPITEWSGQYRVIVMDQRNAGGRSKAPITAQDNWDTYTSDHLAVLDHLGIKKCHLFGQCIGGSFIANLIEAQPERVQSAIWAQPIGRVGAMKPGRTANFDGWVKSLTDHPEATEQVLEAFFHNLYDPGFIYSADREFVKNCKTPSLLLAGNDEAHPRPISDELSQLLPNVEYILDWKSGEALEAAKKRVMAFLEKNTPAAPMKPSGR